MTRPGYDPALSRRTRTLLRWIGEGGLAARSQLARRFWSAATHPRTVYQALHRLIQQGYLQTAPASVLGTPQDLYVLTAAGGAALSSAPPFVRCGWPSVGERTHLVLGQEVRLHLEQQLARAGQGGQIQSWRTDYLLRHLALPTVRREEIADIEVEWCRTATSPPERFLVEVDGAYYGTMLARKVVAYAAQPLPVVWACLPARAARLLRAVAGYPQIDILILPWPPKEPANDPTE